MTRREFGPVSMAGTFGAAVSHRMVQAQAAGGGYAQRFSVMLWSLGKGLTMEQRLDLVAAAGYSGGELVTEWRGWSTEERKRIVAKKNELGLVFDLMFPGGPSLTDPANRNTLTEQVKAAWPVAQELGCRQFGFKAGPRVAGQSQDGMKQSVADGLTAAAAVCNGSGMELLLEPIDLIEDKREAVNSVADAFEIVRMVNNPQVKVLYDFYHEQRGGGNMIEKLQKNIDLVGLVHIADVPGRHHPGTGEIDFPNIYRALASLHYSRFITMEFVPEGDPAAELKAARLEAMAAMQAS